MKRKSVLRILAAPNSSGTRWRNRIFNSAIATASSRYSSPAPPPPTRPDLMMLRHLPNLLTSLRLAAAPTTAGLLVAGHFNAAFGLFAVAGLSDAADGFLAKRFGLDSPLGRVLDPTADKALMLAAFVTLAILDDVPVWLAALVIT